MIKHTVEVLNVQNKQNSGIQFRLSGEQDACFFATHHQSHFLTCDNIWVQMLCK